MLGAIALVLADRGDIVALACVFVALVGSFLISYTRAKAEALGLKGDVGLMARLERIVLLAVVLPFGRPRLAAALRHLRPGRADRDHRGPADRLRQEATQHESGGIGMAETASQNGHPRARARCASPSSASATAPRRSCRASSTTGTLRRRLRTRPDARRPGRLPHLGHRVHGRVRHRHRQGRPGPVRGDLPRPEQHRQVLRRAQAGRPRAARHDPRRHRQVPLAGDHQGARRDRRRRPHPAGDQDRRGRLLPAGRLRGGDQVVRRAGARSRLRLRQLHPGVHRPRALLAAPLRGEGPADRRRRHQVAGRRHHRPPRARPACSTSAASSSSAPTS